MDDDDELRRLTEPLFGYLSVFADDWARGWRPGLDRWHDGDAVHEDILFISPLGSYCRASRQMEERRGMAAEFDALRTVLLRRGLHIVFDGVRNALDIQAPGSAYALVPDILISEGDLDEPPPAV